MKLAPVLLLGAALARATPAAAADELLTTEAKQRMAEGKKLYGEGKYDAAWLKYVEACVVLKTDGCTRGLAFTAYKSGRYLAAYGYAKQLLEPAPKPGLTPAVVEELGRMKKEAYAKIGHVEVEAPMGAIVLLDDEMVGRAPITAPVDVDVAEHTIAANIGGKAYTRKVTTVAGAVTRVHFDEPPPQAEAAAPPVVIAITPPPVTTSGLAPRATEDTPPAPAATNPWHTWLPVGLGVGAVALAGGGIYFAARSSHDDNEASRLRSGLPSNACASGASPSCAAIADAVHGSQSARTASIGMFAGAGALAIGAVVSFVLIPPRADATGVARTRVVPMADRGTVGASWVATF